MEIVLIILTSAKVSLLFLFTVPLVIIAAGVLKWMNLLEAIG